MKRRLCPNHGRALKIRAARGMRVCYICLDQDWKNYWVVLT